MATVDLHRATAGKSRDLYYVETGDFDPATYISVYLIDGERPAVVDTGTGANADVLVDALAQLDLSPAELEAIVLTHVHLDHAGGAGYLAEAAPNADVYVHEAGAKHLVDPARLWAGTKAAVGDQIQFYADPRPIEESRIVPLEAGDRIDLGDRELVAHPAPGHAFHQFAFEDQSTGGVFTGDAAGILTPGLERIQPTSPPPDFDLESCLADLESIDDLDPSALYLAHFGDHEPAGFLSRVADVLESWVESIAETRAELGDEQTVEQFAERADTVEAWGPVKARAEARMNVRGAIEYLDGTGE
ncbi:MAG: MBL fold metallo-hydrolase [Halodesulfurarchaeum sp.]